MSEKLARCRNELSAAIRRALEGPPPLAITHLMDAHTSLIQYMDSTWGQDATPSPAAAANVCLSPSIDHFADLSDHHVNLQKTSSRVNVLPLPCAKSSAIKNFLSETIHPSLQDCEDPSPPDITQDLLDIIESTRSPVMAEISQNLNCGLDISKDFMFSLVALTLTTDETTQPAESITEPALGSIIEPHDSYELGGISELDITKPATGGSTEPDHITEAPPSDDQIIEIVLDLEDEYSILGGTENQ